MDEWTNKWTDEWTDEWTNAWTDEWTNEWTKCLSGTSDWTTLGARRDASQRVAVHHRQAPGGVSSNHILSFHSLDSRGAA